MTKKKKLAPIHPGEIIKEDLLGPYDLSVIQLARELGVPENRLYQIIKGDRRISADTDLRLCKYFGLSRGFFLRVQNRYDLDMAEDKIEKELKKIEPLNVA